MRFFAYHYQWSLLLAVFALTACSLYHSSETEEWSSLDYAGVYCKNNPTSPGCTHHDDSLSAIGRGKGGGSKR